MSGKIPGKRKQGCKDFRENVLKQSLKASVKCKPQGNCSVPSPGKGASEYCHLCVCVTEKTEAQGPHQKLSLFLSLISHYYFASFITVNVRILESRKYAYFQRNHEPSELRLLKYYCAYTSDLVKTETVTR